MTSKVSRGAMSKEKCMERLLTTEEVAELLRIDPVTVRRLIMRKNLPAYRIAGEFRFAPSGLDRFLESQRVVPNIAENQFGDNFTERVRRVFSLATEEARRYNHTSIGTEHIVLAIMREKGGIAAKVLNQLQVQPDAVRLEIEALHPAGVKPPGEEKPGMTEQAQEALYWPYRRRVPSAITILERNSCCWDCCAKKGSLAARPYENRV